ncbi:ADAMTS-like protein 3 [Pteropus alecto]|uniref:ADAMTS-like protein 3 n=1 Tax=Pteropus alecto TaxID=9402 RepID=L5L4G1_PTEAL|nr:ADAMTS-like protein 3 [Pteropus alecto]
MQRRSFVCVEESMHGEILQVEEWKCMYAPKPKVMQACNLFDCPKWIAMDWSQCTVTCGRGLRYRVVLCINHRGQHVGGCNPQLKLHIKEECIIPIPCYKPKEKGPVEAKLPWLKQAQELEETRMATEEPTFIPEPWSACSTTCGPGVQAREVKCRVLLTFTQTETELPEEECAGPRLPAERPCLLRACDDSPASLELDVPLHEKDSQMTYDWEYAGFTPCSATCLGGHQEAIAVCLHLQTQQTVNETLCDMVHRPPAMSQACNTEPCPPRWHTGSWGPCSATCGVGIQTRDVHCLHPGEPPTPAEECRDEKPHALQACNQFDCPPSWHIEEWQQCPRTCGGGTQHRRVACRQLLTDGSFLNLSDGLCQGPKASSRKSCARTDCPPHLAVGDWSKCSVSCGVGTQRRTQVCQRLTAKGQRVPLGEASCRGLPGPPLVRPCHMPVCSSKYVRSPLREIKPEVKAEAGEQGPLILGVQRVYIQTREEKRIQLTVGSRAYLLPNTSVIMKCPVRRFQKSLIQWEKDGHCLQNSRRLGITRSGSLKIHSLAAADSGVYRCVAGSAQDTLVLKLIGTDNRLIAPPALRDHSREHPEMDRLGTTWHKMRQMWTDKNELYPDDGHVHNQPFLRALLGPCRNSPGNPNSWDVKHEQFEAALQQGAYSMDTAQFDELIRNMSQLMETGEVSDDLASQVIYQLVAELAKAQPARMPWGGIREETPPTAQLRGETGSAPQRASAKTSGKLTFKPKGPVLVRQSQPPAISFNKTVNSRIGNTVYITKRTAVINILCELVTPGEAAYTWTKDGVLLQGSDKIIWSGMGKIQIRNPTKKEQGLYGCSVANSLGSDVETSPVLYAEAPIILATERHISGPQHDHLSVVVGGTVEAAPRANVTIRCPVKGTYVCTATNALGEAVASSVLRLLGPFWRLGDWTHCSATCGHLGARLRRPQCVMANGQEVSEALCGHLQKPPARSQPCGIQDCPPRWEQSSEALLTIDPRIRLRHSQHRLLLTDGAKLTSAFPGWWCPGRCLGRAVTNQTHRAVCRHHDGADSGCSDGRRPALRRNCSSGACDACWRTGPWRPCTAACGRGFQSRKVDCVHRSSCRLVADRHCAQGAKPSSWQHCVGPSCDSMYPSQVSRLSQVSDPRGARLVSLVSEGPVRMDVLFDTTDSRTDNNTTSGHAMALGTS